MLITKSIIEKNAAGSVNSHSRPLRQILLKMHQQHILYHIHLKFSQSKKRLYVGHSFAFMSDGNESKSFISFNIMIITAIKQGKHIYFVKRQAVLTNIHHL